MNFIFSFIASVCASCVFIGVLQLLLPSGNMNKSVKYILSLVFLLSVISAAGIVVKNADFSLKLEKNTSTTEAAHEMEILSAKYVYSTALQKANIIFSEITVLTDKLPDSSIYISKVIIKTKSDRQMVINALGEAAENIEVEVINE